MQKQLGLRSPYQAQGLCRQARALLEPELAAAVVRLAELDQAVKGGSRLDPRLELELALVEISGRLSAQTAAAAVAALVSLACTAVIADAAGARRDRGRAPLIAWTTGFALFTVATGVPLVRRRAGLGTRACSGSTT